MRKTKKLFSVVLSLAMIATSFNYNVADAKADTVDDISTEANIALGKSVTYSHMHADGDGTTADKVTDGSLTTAHFVINDENNNWDGAGSASYITVDLGDYYKASSIDKIFIAYKDTNANDTVLNRSYSVQYSSDGVNFDSVVEEKTVTELGTYKETVDDVSSATGTVRYVRVYYPTTANFGIQLKEVAVLSANPEKAEVDKPSVPTIQAESRTNGTITVTVSELAEGDTANIYLNGKIKIEKAVNGEYNIDELSKGTYTICAEAVRNSITSAKSEEISVDVDGELSISEKITNTDYNIAIGKSVAVSDNVREGTLAGINDANFSTKCAIAGDSVGWGTGKESSATIDLNDTYDASTLDLVTVDYLIAAAGAGVTVLGKPYTISYSSDGTNFTNVVEKENAQYDDANANRTIDDVSSQTGKVRYIKITWPVTADYGMQVTEIAVIAPNAQTVEVDKCDDAAGVELSSEEPNTISYKVIAGDNQEGYTYSVFLDGTKKIASGINAGEKYTTNKIPGGTHFVSVVSAYNGMVSDGITSDEVEVLDYDVINKEIIEGTKNIACINQNADAKVVSVSSFYNEDYNLETSQVGIDGLLPTGEGASDAIRTAAGEPASVVVDLGDSYAKGQFDKVLVDFPNPRVCAGTFKVSVSETNTDESFEKVGELTDYAAGNDPGVNIAAIPLDLSEYSKNGVRYVKVDMSAGSNGWGYCINEIGVILNVDVEDAAYATSKTMVEVPEINSKVYTGENLVADIEENEIYEATVNNGGVNVGEYDVTLSLKDPDNYYWAGDKRAKDKDKVVKFKITKANNEWLDEVKIVGWKYGETPAEQTVEPKWGKADITFATAEDGEYTATAPTAVGHYFAKVAVSGTDNYNELTTIKEFDVEKGDSDAPFAEFFEVVDSTLAENEDGAIFGITSEYEYRHESATEYKDAEDGVAKNLVAGKYYIRTKETENYKASDDVEIIVKTGRQLEVIALNSEGIKFACDYNEILFNYGTKYTFKVSVDEGYKKTDDFAVVVNGGKVLSDVDGVYTLDVTENAIIRVRGVEEIVDPSSDALPFTMELPVGGSEEAAVGNYNAWVFSDDCTVAKFGVDEKNPDHIAVKVVSNLLGIDTNVKIDKEFTGLTAGEPYKIEMTLKSKRAEGSITPSFVENETKVGLTGEEQKVTGTFIADASGKINIVVALGEAGLGNTVDIKGITLKDKDGKQVYPKEEPTEKPTVVPTQKPTVAPTQATTAKVAKPAQAKVVKVFKRKKSAKKIKISLKKIKNAKGYQIAVYKTKKNAKKNKKALFKKNVTKIKATIKSNKFKGKKKLFIRVRAFNKKGSTKVFGKWSAIKTSKAK